jgi:FdhD protein
MIAEHAIFRLALDGSTSAAGFRELAEECPVAFEVNGLGYAVMLASPSDLEDFAIGFALSERLATCAEDVTMLDIAKVEGGHIARLTIPSLGSELSDRVRLRATEGGCGLCGTRSIEEVLAPPVPLTAKLHVTRAAITASLAAISDFQPLGQANGAMHAAAFCDPDGKIRLAREDVGRHNALDKLIGAMARAQVDSSRGFMLLTARCSVELVDKTARCGCPLLVTISAPTTLAVERAKAAGLTLLALARPDSALVMNDPHRLFIDG